MMRWLVAFLCAWLICLIGAALAWVIGLLIHCAFIPGCYSQLDIETLLRAINIRSVMIKGTLLAIAIVGIVWFKRRHQ